MVDVKQPPTIMTRLDSLIDGILLELLTATIAKVNSQTLKYKTVEKSNFKFKETKIASFSRIV